MTKNKKKSILIFSLGILLIYACGTKTTNTKTYETYTPTPESEDAIESSAATEINTTSSDNTSFEEDSVNTAITLIEMLEIPELKENEVVISHLGYSVSYNETHEQANWIAYELTSEELMGTVERKDRFKPDPDVATGSATVDDYKKSGYDRGHLAPAADMKWSEEVMAESFYFSNMSPQVPGFNRGIWKLLEELVRTWAKEDGALYVVTGGVLQEGLPTIGKNGVSVPQYYYKVVLDYREPEIKAIAFLIPNEKTDKEISTFVVPINRIEELTGINFFPKLEDTIEEQLESTSEFSIWD